MFMINRSAVVVKPKMPYIDWANSIDDDEQKISLGEVTYDPTVYLVDDAESGDDLPNIVKKHYQRIFFLELDAWHRVEEDWPKKRNY